LSHPNELAAVRLAAHRTPGRSVPYATLQRLAPRSLACLASARRRGAVYPDDPRYAGLRQFGDDVYETLLPTLPAVDFREFDSIRLEVQKVLG